MLAHLHSLAVAVTVLIFEGGAVALIAALFVPRSEHELDGGGQ